MEGLVFIGPGSEWFWAAAQFVVVIVSLGGLYRQLRQTNAANAVQRMESLQGTWNSEPLIQARLRVAIWRKHRTTDVPSFADQAALSSLCGFFENLSDLEAERFITWQEIENTWGQPLVIWWALLRPTIEALRQESSPRSYAGFEHLAERAERLANARGERWSIADLEIPAVLDAQIGRNTARLEILRDAASGAIPREPAVRGTDQD
jgi:hypothetical protein